MGVDIKSLLSMQQMMLEQMSAIFESVGIEIYIDTIVLNPKDCESEEGNYCIDYVWRIKCKDVFICNALRQEIKAEEGKEGGEAEAEEGEGD